LTLDLGPAPRQAQKSPQSVKRDKWKEYRCISDTLFVLAFYNRHYLTCITRAAFAIQDGILINTRLEPGLPAPYGGVDIYNTWSGNEGVINTFFWVTCWRLDAGAGRRLLPSATEGIMFNLYHLSMDLDKSISDNSLLRKCTKV